jgi:hypothetical protein
MTRRLLLICLLGLMPVVLRAQSTSGGGSVTGGGQVMNPVNPQHSVTLTWAASTTSGVTGYNVYRSTTNGGPYTQLTSTPVTGTTYTDTSVAPLTTYYYVVTALVGSSQSGYSGAASALVP